MTAGIWTERFRVRSYEITPRGTASVLALADYLPEAAGHHAAELGVSMQDLLDDGRAWVLARLRLNINRLPRWEDEVVVETWPSGLDRLYATREFVVRAAGDADDAEERGPEIARATSAWLVIDVERRRPLRPPSMLRTLETPDRPPALASESSGDASDGEAGEIGDAQADVHRTFTVRYHDLDLNRHVNNVRYLEWAVETLPTEVLDERRCTSLSLQFQAETTLGDPVQSRVVLSSEDGARTDALAETSLRADHHLVHADTGRTLATATTTWM